MRSLPSQDVAVSPAIGTILLVAMTVIFVALVAVVVMGLSNGMFDSKQVGLTLTPYGIESTAERGISLTIHGGADVGDLVSLSAALNGPELVYRETGNSSLINPLVGQDYRFKAVEKNTTLSSNRGAISVELVTTEIQPVPEEEYWVTVTGTFRDGTEQVLLIQRVTLPAIPGENPPSNGEYFSLYTYSLDENYPGHGFTLIINDGYRWSDGTADSSKTTITRNTVTFTVTSSELRDNSGFKVYRDARKNPSYDISPTALGGNGNWINTPYPVLSTYPALGTLIGNVTVTFTVNGESKTENFENVVVPPRVNFFENRTKIAGTLSTNSEGEISLNFYPKDISLHTNNPNLVGYYDNKTKAFDMKITTLDSPVTITLKNSQCKFLDVFVLAKIIGTDTQVWYRVASVPVNTLFNS